MPEVLSWLDKKESLFRIRWLHKATDCWEVGADGVIFKEWCIHTGKWLLGILSAEGLERLSQVLKDPSPIQIADVSFQNCLSLVTQQGMGAQLSTEPAMYLVSKVLSWQGA